MARYRTNCAWCAKTLPEGSTARRVYCSDSCATAAGRKRRQDRKMGRPMSDHSDRAQPDPQLDLDSSQADACKVTFELWREEDPELFDDEFASISAVMHAARLVDTKNTATNLNTFRQLDQTLKLRWQAARETRMNASNASTLAELVESKVTNIPDCGCGLFDRKQLITQ